MKGNRYAIEEKICILLQADGGKKLASEKGLNHIVDQGFELAGELLSIWD